MPIANPKHRRRLDRDPPIALDEWPRYRDIRMQALRESPHAFASTWEAEAARKDENWSARISAAAVGDTDRALLVVCRSVLRSQKHHACDANQVEQSWLACRHESEFGKKQSVTLR